MFHPISNKETLIDVPIDGCLAAVIPVAAHGAFDVVTYVLYQEIVLSTDW